MTILNYNYSNDKDFIFQKDSIKIREKFLKEILKNKNFKFNEKYTFKNFNLKEMMDKDYKMKKNLMMRLEENHQKYLSEGYYFKNKINNSNNSLPKLSTQNSNENIF